MRLTPERRERILTKLAMGMPSPLAVVHKYMRGAKFRPPGPQKGFGVPAGSAMSTPKHTRVPSVGTPGAPRQPGLNAKAISVPTGTAVPKPINPLTPPGGVLKPGKNVIS